MNRSRIGNQRRHILKLAAFKRRVDLLQAWHRVVMMVRGALWSLYASVIMRGAKVGGGISCFGWPRLTNRNGRIVIGPKCSFGSGEIKVTTGAKLVIGDRVMINDGFVIAANESVQIGDDSLIGEYVSIRDADHGFERLDLTIAAQGIQSAPINIGADVWIGRGSVILKGVTIGRGAVIGANSVVTKDVAAFDIVVGSPAKRLRSRLGAASPSGGL